MSTFESQIHTLFFYLITNDCVLKMFMFIKVTNKNSMNRFKIEDIQYFTTKIILICFKHFLKHIKLE